MNEKIKNKNKPSSKAIGKMIRISPYKLNLEAKSIRGRKVDDALSYLEFSKKRISNTVRDILQSAIANAENNHALDIDKFSSPRCMGPCQSEHNVMPPHQPPLLPRHPYHRLVFR